MVAPTAPRSLSNIRRSRLPTSPARQTRPRLPKPKSVSRRVARRVARLRSLPSSEPPAPAVTSAKVSCSAARPRICPHLAEVAFGKAAGTPNRQRGGFGNAERKLHNGVAGLMTGDTAAHVGRPFGLAAAHGLEQILQRGRPPGCARRTSGHADPAFDVGPGMPACGEHGGAEGGTRKIAAEMDAKDADQP